MKKLTYLIVVLITASLALSQAQAQKIHNPDAKVTVTTDQIKTWGAPTDLASSSTIPLTFEGLGNLDEIAQFYNGGLSSASFSGTNYGIYFSRNAIAIINTENGGTGNFASEAFSHTAMFFLTGSSITLNDPKGFADALSILYVSSGTGTVSVYDELDGTGNLLASLILPATTQAAKVKGGGATFNIWKHLGVSFSGKAKSVTFTGTPNQCAFDNIILGSDSPEKAKAVGAPKSKPETSVTVAGETTSMDPTDKGRWFLGGANRLGLSVGKDKEKVDGNLVDGTKKSYFDFYFQPRVGYFIIDNLVGGLYMDVDITSDKSKETTGFSTKGATFTVGPFVRYYIPICDKFIPFAEAQVGFGIDNSSYKSGSSSDWSTSKSSVFTYRLGGGATYFFNKYVGADVFAGFQHDSQKYKESSSGGTRSGNPGSTYVYNNFVIMLGLVVILDL